MKNKFPNPLFLLSPKLFKKNPCNFTANVSTCNCKVHKPLILVCLECPNTETSFRTVL